MSLKTTVAALLAVCWAVAAVAAPIGSNDVVRAMGNWRHRGGTLGAKMGRTVKDVRRVEKDGAEFYIVRFEGGGHLIAPTDTKLRPVVLFSEADDFDLDERNPALALVVADVLGESDRFGVGGEQGPKAASLTAAPRSRNENAWADLLDDDIDAQYWDPIDDARVGPLCKTAWSQGSVGDGYCYNYYTPNHAVCGCVATGLSQIMKYFEWPKGDVQRFTSEWTQLDGVSTNMTTQGGSFDWANMPDLPEKTANLNETQRRAIGKLTSDVGILAGMHYTTTGGSSSWTTIVRYVLTQTVLGYSNAMMIRIQNDAPTGAEEGFKRVVIANFNAKRPVQFGIEGHSIVGDGYGYHKGDLYYHLNLGWAGHWTCWYSVPVNAENPIVNEPETKFTYFKSIIYNIYTDEDPDLVILSGRVTDKYTKEPVASQSVTAYAADGKTPVATATTDEKGIYSMLVLPGTYTVVACNENPDRRSGYYGSAVGEALRCVTQENKGQSGTQSPYGPAEMGNCADCDLEMENVDFAPEAEVSVGEATVGTDFAEAVVPVVAKVVHYGQTATSAKVIVKLASVDGGAAMTKEFTVGGDFDAHEFNASFEGLTAGEKYTVTARVVMNADEAGSGDGGFAAAREFVWFDESASSFTAAKWSGEPVVRKDGMMVVSCANGTSTTFTPESAVGYLKRIVIKLREIGAYMEDAIPSADGPAAVSAVVRSDGRTELVVWGDGVWNATGVFFEDENVDFDVVIEMNFRLHNVSYILGGSVLGTFDLPDSFTTVASVSFAGCSVLSELQGTAWDVNLVKDANGVEYANYEAAKAGGATGVLSPLWLSTWNLAGGSGTLDVKDPDGLITFTGASKVLKSETQPDGSERKWYAEANDADIAAGAAKYIQTTVDLGLAKAITDDSVVKIGDYLVANGEMSFVVEIDDVVVAKETVKNLVEVRATMEAGSWTKPSDDEIDFKNGKVIVTPNKGGASGFARVKIPPAS